MMAEKELIAQIRRLARVKRNLGVRIGIGDDCAVLRLQSGRGKPTDTLITTDFTLEGIHFRRDWHSAESVGHRCLVRGLSDIAAMGGKPVAAFLSLALPRDLAPNWVARFVRSLVAVAQRYGLTLAGGDTAESPNGILADVIVIGTVPKEKSILRSGARPEDSVYVTGKLGGSAAAIAQMKKRPRKKLSPRQYRRHFFPEPRIEVARLLQEKGLASAMIDTSDGLSTDLTHICQESGVGAEIHAKAIPRASVGNPSREVELEFALHGGEDYELLFTAPGGKRVPPRIAGVPVTCIGQITRGRKVFLKDESGARCKLQPEGWEHFR